MEKFVDESWKESVWLEKERLSRQQQAQPKPTEDKQGPSEQQDETGRPNEVRTNPVFLEFISGLVYQALVFLGEVPHPVSRLKEKNLGQARMMIETLKAIQEKTSGRLSREEEDLLNGSLYELQVKYVEAASSQGAASAGGGPNARPS